MADDARAGRSKKAPEPAVQAYLGPGSGDPGGIGLLAMVSHEIRSQANTIIGFTELLRDTKLDPEQREYVERLVEAARRLVRFTTDVVDLGGVRSGGFRVRHAVFHLPGAVAAVHAAMLPGARRKGLELHQEVAPDVPENVVGDGERLHQILTNLVRNAIQFTEKGEVQVRVRTAARSERFSTLLFSVTDTGIGISLERREAIFEPFEQEHAGIRQRFGGSGLGLAIARHLVHRMGGNVWVESEPGVGSTFHFLLRLDHASEPLPGDPRFPRGS